MVVSREDAEALVTATHARVVAATAALAQAQAARLEAIMVATSLPGTDRVTPYRIEQLTGVPQMTIGRWIKGVTLRRERPACAQVWRNRPPPLGQGAGACWPRRCVGGLRITGRTLSSCPRRGCLGG